MSRENRVNSQFYKKLRLNKEIMEVIKHFRKIKKYMMCEREGVDYEQKD